jgi:hypothetical protein
LNNLIDSTLVDDFADASLFEYEDAQNVVIPRLERLLGKEFVTYGVEE